MKHRARKADLRSYSPELVCEAKRAFPTEKQAREAADYQMLQYMTLSLAVYKCPTCGYWHLTRQAEPAEELQQ